MIGRDHLSALRQIVRPLATQIANVLARGVVRLVVDGAKLQRLQVDIGDGEPIDDGEHHQPYGFSSIPLAGAECVVAFPRGDRSHPIVIATSDRRFRPSGGQPGEVTVYARATSGDVSRVVLTAAGDIELHPAPGREILITDGSGTPQRLVTKADFDAHMHISGTLAAPPGGGAVTGITGLPNAPATGTQRLRSQ